MRTAWRTKSRDTLNVKDENLENTTTMLNAFGERLHCGLNF